MSELDTARKLLELIRFSHTIFALPFALLAAVMAWTTPAPSGHPVPFRWTHLLGIVVCMVGARSFAMAFNRVADRRIDAQNPRTSRRHLPAGTLRLSSVVALAVFSAAVFVGGTLLFLPNPLPLILAVPVLLFVAAYSYAKRFTSLAHFWLGASLLLAPVATWIALRGLVVIRSPADIVPALLLGMAVMCWVAGFDIIYACQDYEFDRQARLKSIPARLGVRGALRVSALCHLAMLALLVLLPLAGRWIGPELNLGWIYLAGVAAVAVLLLYEHSVVRPDDLTRVNVAFFHVNAIVSFGLFLVTTADLLVN